MKLKERNSKNKPASVTGAQTKKPLWWRGWVAEKEMSGFPCAATTTTTQHHQL